MYTSPHFQVYALETRGQAVGAYRMVDGTGPTRSHVQMTVKGRRRCGWYEGGEYRVIAAQPSDDILRSTESWRTWVAGDVGYQLNPDGSIQETAP
jgi:hypothetical protein